VETFTLFVLLAANICGPIPPTWQSHECGMPRPIAEHLSKDDCEQRRQETLMAGDDAYCVSDTAEHSQGRRSPHLPPWRLHQRGVRGIGWPCAAKVAGYDSKLWTPTHGSS
jgi:hypothetical protein